MDSVYVCTRAHTCRSCVVQAQVCVEEGEVSLCRGAFLWLRVRGRAAQRLRVAFLK